MKVMVGLGNPGEQYAQTRHNVGFLFVDYVVTSLEPDRSPFHIEAKFQAQLAATKNDRFLLIKPQTYMNNSGLAVKKILDFYQLMAAQSLVLIHDDLDIPFGEYKLQLGKGPKGHKGVDSVVAFVGESEFWRVRIGIAGNTYKLVKQQGGNMKEDYVLKIFSHSEQVQLPSIFTHIYYRLDHEMLTSSRESP